MHPLWLAIKTAISLGLILAVFWKLDLAAIWERSSQLPSAVVLAVILMFAVQAYVAAWRWWVILRHHDLGIRLLVALRICLIGAFFNQLLPSSIGGDVARAWYVYKGGSSKKISLITVLSDRMYGMLALVCLAIVLFPVLVYSSIGSEALIAVGTVVVGASSALMVAFWLDCLPGWMQRWTFIRHLSSVSEAARAITTDRSAVAPLLGLSILIHVFTILAILILLGAVTTELNLVLCAALIPVIMLMSMVPVSIAGWGVRESIMIYGLGLAKVPADAALIASILVGLSLAAVGLLGGLIWLTQTIRDRPRQPVA